MSDFFLADDLSGALDAAAAFHAAGQRVTVAWGTEAWPHAVTGEVIGFTTETRNAPEETAARAVRDAIARGSASGGRLLYKKIDSTLRGPVAAELAALAAALPATRILFLPANPHAGRTVRDGVLLVHGRPVAETEFAADLQNPVTQSSIPKLLEQVRTPRTVLADAESADDLALAVSRMQAGGGEWVAVGSGALARPVAAVRFPAAGPAAITHPQIPAGPVLFIGGSAHPVNREQCGRLARACGVPICELNPAESEPAVRRAITSAQSQGVAVLVVTPLRTDPELAVRAISSAAAEVIAAAGVRRVFVTGGETAFALCRTLGVSSLKFLQEVEPGLSLSEVSQPAGSLLLAVKPGGFGDASTWMRAWAELRRPR
jgi:uncharacterized protein YgbK (DUF1537 family)